MNYEKKYLKYKNKYFNLKYQLNGGAGVLGFFTGENKKEREKAEQERAEKERAEQERAEQERAEQERAEKKKAEQERAEQERAEQERAERERLVTEQLLREQEKNLAKREQAKREQLAREQAEREQAKIEVEKEYNKLITSLPSELVNVDNTKIDIMRKNLKDSSEVSDDEIINRFRQKYIDLISSLKQLQINIVYSSLANKHVLYIDSWKDLVERVDAVQKLLANLDYTDIVQILNNFLVFLNTHG